MPPILTAMRLDCSARYCSARRNPEPRCRIPSASSLSTCWTSLSRTLPLPFLRSRKPWQDRCHQWNCAGPGANFWDDYTTGQTTLFDTAMYVEGDSAAAAHGFQNSLWQYVTNPPLGRTHHPSAGTRTLLMPRRNHGPASRVSTSVRRFRVQRRRRVRSGGGADWYLAPIARGRFHTSDRCDTRSSAEHGCRVTRC